MIEPCDAADTPLRAEAGDRRQRSTSGVVTLSQGVFCAVVAVVAGSQGRQLSAASVLYPQTWQAVRCAPL